MVEYDKIFLKKSIVENKNITSEGILAYAGLVIMSENKIDKLFTSLSAIEFALRFDFSKKDRYFKEKLKRGLLNLKENGIINIIHEGSDFKPNDVLAIKLINFKIDTNNELFILENIKTLFKIINYNEKKFESDKFLRYYLVLVGTINNKTKVGFTTIETLADKCDISDWIIKTKYNKLLEDLKIIYIHRYDTCMRYEDGTVRKISNTYGRYSDKEYIIENAEMFNDEIMSYSTKLTGDEARSIKQRYNSLQKKINKGYIPTKEEIDKMNNDIEKYNAKYKVRMEQIDKFNFSL